MVGPKTPKLTLSDFHNKFLFKKCFTHFILSLVALNPTLKVKTNLSWHNRLLWKLVFLCVNVSVALNFMKKFSSHCSVGRSSKAHSILYSTLHAQFYIVTLEIKGTMMSMQKLYQNFYKQWLSIDVTHTNTSHLALLIANCCLFLQPQNLPIHTIQPHY